MICTNIGLKTDVIITNKKTLLRRWLRKRVRIATVHPTRPGLCHASTRHGSKVGIHAQQQRVLGNDPSMPQSNEGSYFKSERTLAYAREKVLLEHGAKMWALARQIELGKWKDVKYEAVIETKYVMGEGLARFSKIAGEGVRYSFTGRQSDSKRRDTGVRRFSDIKGAVFHFEYEKGTWYEVSGYPDLDSACKKFIEASRNQSPISL